MSFVGYDYKRERSVEMEEYVPASDEEGSEESEK